jgi:hypothetical protein
VSSFESRWLAYTPAQEKSLQTPKEAAVKTSKSPEPLVPTQTADTLPRLPWQLERLVSAASSNVLTVELPGVPDVPRYTVAWAASYLTGDRDEALRRLWEVYSAWQGKSHRGGTA